jgi:quinol monooxygenase YgiN
VQESRIVIRTVAAALASVAFAAALVAAPSMLPADEKAEKKAEPSLPEKIKAAGLADKPFSLYVKIKVKAGHEAAFQEIALKTAKAAQAEKGVILYELQQDAADPTGFALFETYRNLEGFTAHLSYDHTKAILAAFGEHCAAGPEVTLFKALPAK